MFISTLDTITKLSTDSRPDRDLVRSQEGVVPDPDQSTRVSYRCGSIDRSSRSSPSARGIDTPATGDGGASPGGGSRFWPRSAAPLGKAALAARRRRIFFHYWAVQIAHPPSENRGEVMLCHRLHPATILRVLSCFLCSLALSLSCAGLALLQLCSS